MRAIDSYEALRAEMEAQKKRTRRREHMARAGATLVLLWMIVPYDDWKPPRLGQTLVTASSIVAVQILLALEWPQRLAERWTKAAGFQMVVTVGAILVVILACMLLGRLVL